VSARTIHSPLGLLRITCADTGMREIAFLGDDDDGMRGGHELLDEAEQQLRAYFGGELRVFDLPLDPIGTDFQKRVWSELGHIPFGATTTYQRIADTLSTSARPVGGANGANPIAIVVPCHRVVGATGLTGYGGGLWRKRWLLEHEGSLGEDRQRAMF
jgi:methylated-DNA-[protein]-cysteine S-methyltransferase